MSPASALAMDNGAGVINPATTNAFNNVMNLDMHRLLPFLEMFSPWRQKSHYLLEVFDYQLSVEASGLN